MIVSGRACNTKTDGNKVLMWQDCAHCIFQPFSASGVHKQQDCPSWSLVTMITIDYHRIYVMYFCGVHPDSLRRANFLYKGHNDLSRLLLLDGSHLLLSIVSPDLLYVY